MTAKAIAVLEPVGEGRIALVSVEVRAGLRGLLSETEVTQTYCNLEAENIEAVYSFPLPLDAVLLELELTLNGNTLRGQVQAKARAEARYEEAIDEGDSAVLLQAAGPGLFTINVGNLMAGERAVIRFRYAQLHHWQGNSLRFHLPTTIAPRYGDPAAAGLAPHQVPEHVLSAERGFSLSVTLAGAHARADFECPSHAVTVHDDENVREITLNGGAALMDRDFVLVLREADRAPEGLWCRDGEGVVALASFHPGLPEDRPKSGRRVTILVDCSGSMAGDSIGQARTALEEILAMLAPPDRFNLIAFGSTYRNLFPAPVPADGRHIEQATRFVGRLDAGMGGTEIGAALEAAYRGGPADILLITDGEVWDVAGIIARAEQAGNRIFTVGVGSAVAEAFVRALAMQTGGACELVSPREDMAERIVRHFRRMDQPRASGVRIDWPSPARRQVPETLDGVYGGDTVHVLGWLAQPPGDHATLVLTLGDGREHREQVKFARAQVDEADSDTLPRIAAYRRLPGLSAEEATALALDYQLVTDRTSCVLVHQREEGDKAQKVPALRKVPQTLAAGWGGAGSVMAAEACMSLNAAPEDIFDADTEDHFAPGDSLDYQEIPEFTRSAEPAGGPLMSPEQRRLGPPVNLDRLVAALNAHFPDTQAAELDLHTLADLVNLGLDVEMVARLADLLDARNTEQAVVVALLAAVAQGPAGGRLSRHARRLIRRAERETAPAPALLRAVAALIRGGENGGAPPNLLMC